MNKKKIIHIVLGNGLHCIHVGERVNVYTEEEYQELTWWKKVKMKYFKSDD
jgi:hypothetical protein